MPWCPNCLTEYRPGFRKCADCGAALVEKRPAPPQPAPETPAMTGPVPVVSVNEGDVRAEYATLLSKTPYIEKWGAYRPGHALLLLFRFRFDSGGEVTFALDDKAYGSMRVGERDLLTMLDGLFLDFGGRFGEPMDGNQPDELPL